MLQLILPSVIVLIAMAVSVFFADQQQRERPDAEAIAAADNDWVTMHGPKIEHKRRQGELNAALACGGGTEQIADDSLPPAEILAAQAALHGAEAKREAA